MEDIFIEKLYKEIEVQLDLGPKDSAVIIYGEDRVCYHFFRKEGKRWKSLNPVWSQEWDRPDELFTTLPNLFDEGVGFRRWVKKPGAWPGIFEELA